MAKKLTDEDVATRFAAAGLVPLEPYIDSHTPRLCTCTTCGSTIKARLTWFSRGNGACNICAYRQRSQSLRKYTTAMAEAKMREMGFEPLEPFPGRKDVPWLARCVACGHEATPLVKTLERGHGCQKCSAWLKGADGRKQRAPKAHADMIAAGVEPLDSFPGTAAPWRSRCLTCGEEVWPRLSSVRSGQGACKVCSSGKVADFHRFSHEKAASLMLEAGFKVLEPYVNSNTPWASTCLKCNNPARPTFAAATGTRQGACFECGRRKISENKVLDSDVAAAVMRVAKLEPLEPYPGSDKPWRCRCMRCDREVTPRRAGILKGQGGCKYCATTGLDRTAPGVLYLLRHESFQTLKIGVTSTASKTDRVEKHLSFGWEEIRRWDFENAGNAEAVESLVLSMWRRDIGAPPAMAASDMPQGGFSETVAMLWVSAEDAISHAERAISALN